VREAGFSRFPEPSSRSLSVRSLILCSVEGLLPLFLPLSLTVKLFIAIVHSLSLSHTHTHTQACIAAHRCNQAEMATDTSLSLFPVFRGLRRRLVKDSTAERVTV